MPGNWQPPRRPLPLHDLALRSTTVGVTTTLMAGPKSSSVVRKLAPGIYAYGPDGYRFFARIKGRLHSIVFRPPRALALSEVKDAYGQWRATLTEDRPSTSGGSTLAEDVATYLSRVSAMPSFRTREGSLNAWVAALGPDRPRASITTADIDVVFQKWLTEGYAIKTLKLRRTDLCQVWVKLDGPHAPNPARHATLPSTPPLEPRGMTIEQVERIFLAMPECAAKTRLWVMATTGLPQKQIGELKETDLDLEHRQIRTQARRKGHGAAGGWRPITPAAVEALRAFHAAGLYGPFDNSTLWRVFHRARKRAGIPGHRRPYDLRHSFGTWIYDATGDLSAAATLLGHAKLDTAVRYTLGARRSVAQRATDTVQIPVGLGAKVDHAIAPKVSRKSHPPS